MEPYFSIYEDILKEADDWVDEPSISYGEFDSLGDASKRLYGEIFYLAIEYLLSEDTAYYAKIEEWMDRLESFSDWGLSYDNLGLGAAHILFGFSLTYDWLYDHFPAAKRTTYRAKLIEQADYFYNCLVSSCNSFMTRYLSNHMYVKVGSLMVAALAIRDEDLIKSDLYANEAYSSFTTLLTYLPPDGAYSEGIGYWAYGMVNLVLMFEAEAQIFGTNRILNHNYFAKMVDYRIHATAAGFEHRFWYGDAFISTSEFDISSYLVIKLRDTTLYSLIMECEKYYSNRKNILTFLSADHTIPLYEFKDISHTLPTYHYFSDLGLFTSRNSWSVDDEERINFIFISGPPSGHQADELEGIGRGSYKGGHQHPHSGSFHLFFYGVPLIIEDLYVHYKLTKDHNIVTFDNGEGQYGEKDEWFDKSLMRDEEGWSKIIHTDFRESIVEYLVTNLTRAYPLSLKLKKYLRHVLFLKKKYVIIFDDIESEVEHKMNFHLHGHVDGERISSNNVFIHPKDNRIRYKLFDLTPFNHEIIHSKYMNVVDGDFISNQLNISTVASVKKEIFRVVIIPFFDNSSASPTIGHSINGHWNTITFDDETFSINLKTFQVVVGTEEFLKALVITLSITAAVLFVCFLVIFIFIITITSVLLFKRQSKGDIEEKKDIQM